MTVNPLILKAQGAERQEDEYIVVNASPFCIGRRPDNSSQIPRPEISGQHAIFSQRDSRWELVDCESTNGTFVNGVRVAEPTPVHVGDVVQFATRAYKIVESPENEVCHSRTKVLPDTDEFRGTVDLVNIIAENRTYPHFQSIVRLDDGAIIGWEALGRGMGSDGPMNAGDLFWLAERSQLEARLSARFREATQACLSCGHCWRNVTPPKHIFLNFHPQEIEDHRFFDLIDDLGRSPIRRWCQPVVEVSESLACNSEEMRYLFTEIRRAGLLVAYDDFGKGQSRLPDLVKTPPDFLKLDRELVASIDSNRVKLGLVKAIADACRELRVRVLGEGIETAVERDVCHDLGIELGQGYFFDRPAAPFDMLDVSSESLPSSCSFVRLDVLQRGCGRPAVAHDATAHVAQN